MNLLYVIPTMLAHWIYYLFSWASTTHLLYFTSCCGHEPTGCHSCHVGSLGLLPLFLGFHNPFALLLPLVVPIGLLAIILVLLAHWVYSLFSWVSTAHLLYFFILLCPWAYWLSFLLCWPIGFITSFLGLLQPIYFTFHSSTSIFLSPSPIVGLLMPLCFLSKISINNRRSNSHHKLLQVGHNFLILYHFPLFLFSFFQRTLRFKILV